MTSYDRPGFRMSGFRDHEKDEGRGTDSCHHHRIDIPDEVEGYCQSNTGQCTLENERERVLAEFFVKDVMDDTFHEFQVR